MADKMSSISFRMMSVLLAIRDFVSPRMQVLEEAGIMQGFQVLEYGCGTGSYTLLAAGLVGESGKVYALDVHPLSIRTVEKKAAKEGSDNIETILSDCDTGLPDGSIDVALFYDTFHILSSPDKVLKEIHRVLKPNGIMSFSDHHMKEKEIVSRIEKDGLFRLSIQAKKTYSFIKG
jgi:ubiquinone/menaquinone biosynthesis C-methylase UbiE